MQYIMWANKYVFFTYFTILIITNNTSNYVLRTTIIMFKEYSLPHFVSKNKMLYIIQFLSAHTRVYVSARAVVRVCARVYVYTLPCHVIILQTVHCKRTEEVV